MNLKNLIKEVQNNIEKRGYYTKKEKVGISLAFSSVGLHIADHIYTLSLPASEITSEYLHNLLNFELYGEIIPAAVGGSLILYENRDAIK